VSDVEPLLGAEPSTADPPAIEPNVAEPETGALAWAATRVRVTRIGPPTGELILFAGEMREHAHGDER